MCNTKINFNVDLINLNYSKKERDAILNKLNEDRVLKSKKGNSMLKNKLKRESENDVQKEEEKGKNFKKPRI